MKEETLKSWEDFENRLANLITSHEIKKGSTELYVSPILYRGQSNHEWHLDTTLERYTGRCYSLYDYYRKIHAAKSRVETFTGKRWHIPTPPRYERWLEKYTPLGTGKFVGYEYMAYLRHHGFPSPLLDWTVSPYLAAYFGFHGKIESAGSVAIFAFIEHFGLGKGGRVDEPNIYSLGPYIRSHERHFLQQSEYTICAKIESEKLPFYSSHEKAFARNDDGQDLLWKFIIPSSERIKVLRKLDMYNINAYSLFGSEDSLIETIALREFLLKG